MREIVLAKFDGSTASPIGRLLEDILCQLL
jgi:hypothetical protein